MLEIVFWVLLALIVYVYAGYPLLMFALTRKPRVPDSDLDYRPKVTLIISCYNEAEVISEKLRNTLSLSYPKEKLEILVVSDASDDGTDDIVETFKCEGVQLLRLPERGGKTIGLNLAAAQAGGEILVFSDANAMYQNDALAVLAAPFADENVGAVIGESSYLEPDSGSGQAESFYWRYETWIKELESRRGSVVGGDGAICSVRKNLYRPMRADALSDFINPLQVVEAGYRCTYERNAVCFEETADEFSKEFGRKVRIVNRAWRALWLMRHMLNPFRFGSFSLKLLSHKVLRWLVPFFQIALLLVNIYLISMHDLYAILFVAQIGFYGFCIVGFLLRNNVTQPAIFRIPYYFCLVNLAAARGLVEALFGRNYTTWSTVRSPGR